jgi:hypothetical protein
VQDTGKLGKGASDVGKKGGIENNRRSNMFPFYCSYSFVLYYFIKRNDLATRLDFLPCLYYWQLPLCIKD